MTAECLECGGAGMVLMTNPAGRRVARVCSCQDKILSGHRVASAKIPKRYQHCSFESFEVGFPGVDLSLANALLATQRFVAEYPVNTDGRGIIFTGTIGVGKTHLAVSTMRALMEEKGAKALFCDYRELLKEIQNTYNSQVKSTELEILRPVFEAEVLVLDELGAQKPTDWVWDTVALILNTRYNDKRTTIITGNYANLPPLEGNLSAPQRATREDTLGDRIGERMRSRLVEMCVPVEMRGRDYRSAFKRASFAFA